MRMEVPAMGSKVRAAGALLVLLLAAGCGDGPANDGDPYRPPSRVQDARFGDPYQVRFNLGPNDAETPPHISGDTLFVSVSYSGGCEDHDFDLDYEARRDSSFLWLEHDANGDNCEALVQDDLQLPVPRKALAPPAIVLLNPEGDVPYTLRWTELGQQEAASE